MRLPSSVDVASTTLGGAAGAGSLRWWARRLSSVPSASGLLSSSSAPAFWLSRSSCVVASALMSRTGNPARQNC